MFREYFSSTLFCTIRATTPTMVRANAYLLKHGRKSLYFWYAFWRLQFGQAYNNIFTRNNIERSINGYCFAGYLLLKLCLNQIAAWIYTIVNLFLFFNSCLTDCRCPDIRTGFTSFVPIIFNLFLDPLVFGRQIIIINELFQ